MENALSIAIIGFPKCATSSLAEVLGMQGWSNRPIEKELDLLSRDLTRINDFFLDKDSALKKYDASPNVIIDIAKMEKLKALFPRLKVIVSIRNPIDRFISHIYHRLKMGEIRPRDLDKIYNEVLEGTPTDLYEYCRYSYYIGEARRIFGENLYIVESENIDYTGLSSFLKEDFSLENSVSINGRKEYRSYIVNRIVSRLGVLLRMFGFDTKRGWWGAARSLVLELNETNESRVRIKIPKELQIKLKILAGDYRQFL